jgi:hypothetical protein
MEADATLIVLQYAITWLSGCLAGLVLMRRIYRDV